MESIGYKKASQALSDGIRSLFHYQPLDSEQHKIWLTETLLENKIYCSNPADFNDPWDMKPLVKHTYNENDLIGFTEYVGKMPLSNQAANHFSENRTDHVLINEYARKFILGHWRMFEEILRVYCLSLRPDNLLMWSHYANKHSGICLEFDTNNHVFGSAWKVEYHAEYPLVLWADDLDLMRIALTKAKCWENEDEYRILPQTEGDSLPAKLSVGSDNKLLFPSNALKSIIVGCKANYDETLSFIRSIRPDLPVKRAILQSDRYGLHIE
ncbi:DUF2971 domain-containing protein [Pectobacterium odoriferum]|uniref:DUF2971 domain-containing protein n=1 Tax=Pectobacterium odoriferum TaxID=78398 RepID=UPI0032EB97E0